MPLTDEVFSKPSIGLENDIIGFFAGDDTTDPAMNDFLIIRGKITTVIYAPTLDDLVDDGYYFQVLN